MAPQTRRRKLPLWLRVKVFFYRLRYRLETPLALRASVRRLRHISSHPYLQLLRLFLPFPTWHFRVPEPRLSPREILGNESLMLSCRTNLTTFTSIPLWRARDTPLRCLYRLYEAMASGEYAPMGKETEYFWYQRSWTLHKIPHPQDPDPVRLAILACLVEELVTAFNWRLSLGMRRNRRHHVYRETEDEPWPPYEAVSGPEWARLVPPISRDDLVGLPTEYVSSDGKLVLEPGGRSETFAKRNIVTNVGWLYTL
jgi:hypothetical protein